MTAGAVVHPGAIIQLVRLCIFALATLLCGNAGAAEEEFLVGGDISALAKIEELGAVYRDNGAPGDAIEIMRRHGANCFRLRLFVNPTNQGMVVNDLQYTAALAARIKAAGAKFLLDFHYSDTWADPGHQTKPAAWEKLDFESLVRTVYEYTRDSLVYLDREGVLPDLVQIGNEITPGMLWPDGKVSGVENSDQQWDKFARLLKAAAQGVRDAANGRDVRIVIHTASGGNWESTRRFFTNIEQHGVPYDVIGQSAYPWWHGTLDDLRVNLAKTAATFGKDIWVVETAYPYKPFTAVNKRWKYPKRHWPQTPAGQKAFLKALIETVRATPDGHGLGVLWWYPESVPIKGGRIWHNGVTAMFDDNGNALPVLDAFGAATAAAAREKPNILLICIDDLRPVMGCYGGKVRTPSIDRFAETATMFRRHYVQWPVCGPSRATLMSGLRPDSSGIYGNSGAGRIANQPGARPTMPLYFREHGYTTVSFGKTYHGICPQPGCGWSEEPWRPPTGWTCFVNFPYRGPSRAGEEAWRPAYEIYDGPDRLHNDYQTADRAIEALERLKGGPFFIAAGFYKPHLPFVAPRRFWDLYEGEDTTIDDAGLPGGAADFMYNYAEIWAYGVEKDVLFSKDLPPNPTQERDMVRAYYAAVSFIDAQVGRVLGKLEELDLADNTAVVLWGDHGFHLGDHSRWAKHTQFENAMRSPLIIRLPGRQKPGVATDALAETVDVYATLADYAGLETPAHVEGISQAPVISGAASRVKEVAYSQIRPVGKGITLMAYSVRTPDFRYVEWRDSKDIRKVVWRELYDHRTDPEETRSVAGDRRYAGVVTTHARLVRDGYRSLRE